MQSPAYKRVLLKISGEALAAGQGFGVDPSRIHEVAAELADVHKLGIQIAIVVGINLVYFVNYFVQSLGNHDFLMNRGWRYMLASAAIPATPSR